MNLYTVQILNLIIMNAIFENIIEARGGHYCHCVEVSDVYELQCIAESIISEYQDTTSESEIIDFLESLTVYCLEDKNESEVFNFSFTEYIEGTL